MAKASAKANQEVEMDMTPMIDCVFLLMIFFVLVIDLSQKELEDLILPKAEKAAPDNKPPDVRPIANITQDGRIIYRKNPFFDPRKHSEKEAPEQIRKLLLEWKNTVVKETKQENIGGKMVTLVEDPVLVRADKWTEWHWVGVFMTSCSQPDAAFYKIELALSDKDKEARMLQRLAEGK
ncbi:MAG: ExbD/TolR family protein [Planctomycetota bacterium]